MNRVKQNVAKETMVDLESGDIWVKSSEKLTGAELRILNLLRRREGNPTLPKSFLKVVENEII